MSETPSPLALITGGGSGIGEAVARHFAKHGVRVVVADIDAGAAQAVVASIQGEGNRAAALPLDVSDPEAVAQAGQATAQEIGAFHILVNAASLFHEPVPLTRLPLDQHDRTWSVNYRGAYLCCRMFGAQMAEAGRGVIVNVAAMSGLAATPHLADGPAKAALTQLTRSLAAEWGPRGVRVNAVTPGATLTKAVRARLDERKLDRDVIARRAALGRLLIPEEVATPVTFLCSDDARGISGVTVPVDAGLLQPG